MTDTNSLPIKVEKIVVVFDICSSTLILEELLRTDDLKLWRDLLIHLEDYLRPRGKTVGFAIHKFLGDGWILLFESHIDGHALLSFLGDLSGEFAGQYHKTIGSVINENIPNIGLTFGIDRGTLIRIKMNNRDEYVGRPLNIAARLEESLSEAERQDKVLMLKNVYVHFGGKAELNHFSPKDRARTLKNIAGGTAQKCKMLSLVPKTKSPDH